MLKKHEIVASSFDKLRMRVSDFNGLDLMVSLSRFGALIVRPWAASFVSGLLKEEPLQLALPTLNAAGE